MRKRVYKSTDFGEVKCQGSIVDLLAECPRCGSPFVGVQLVPRGYSPTCRACGMDGPVFVDPLDMQKWWNWRKK